MALVIRDKDKKVFDTVITPAYEARVIADGGIVSDIEYIDNQLQELVDVNPTLAIIPSGQKVAKLHSQLPSDGSGDFTVARSTTKVITNSDGNLKTITVNEPPITWENGVPVIQPERQTTQLLTRPISFGHSDWTKSGASIEGDASTAGVEKVVNGDFSAWTGDNPDGWNILGEMGTNPEISEVGSTEGHSGIGTGACNIYTSGGYVGISQDILTIGKFYKLEIDITKITTGAIKIGGAISTDISTFTLVGHFTVYFYSTSATITIARVAGCDVTIDNISIKEVSGFAAPAVDGSGNVLLDAYKLVEDTSNGRHGIEKANALTDNTVDIDRSWSLFIKEGERRYVSISVALISNYNTAFSVVFDARTGTFVSPVSNIYIDNTFTSVQLDNGWWRVGFMSDIGGNAYDNYSIVLSNNDGTTDGTSYQGDGTSCIYIYNAQLEAGSSATSPVYIDKSLEGSVRTRNADAISNTGVADLIGQTEGTVIFTFNALELITADSSAVLSILNSPLRGFGIRLLATNNIQLVTRNNAGQTNTILKTYTLNEKIRIGMSYNFTGVEDGEDGINVIKYSINGSSVSTANSRFKNTGTSYDNISFFDAVAGGNAFKNFTIEDLILITTVLTDAKLQQLTTL